MTTVQQNPISTPSSEPSDSQRRCPNCQAVVPTDSQWCLTCGAALSTRLAETPGWRLSALVATTMIATGLLALFISVFAITDRGAKPKKTPSPTAAATAPTTVPATPPVTPSPPPVSAPITPSQSPDSASGVPPTSAPTHQAPNVTTPTPTPPAATAPTPSPRAGDSAASPTAPPTPTIPHTSRNPRSSVPNSHQIKPDRARSSHSSWPIGKSAWTVVVLSTTSKAQAQMKARSLAGSSASVGVLNSSDFPSLRRGYWVVYSGQFASQAQAQSHARSLGSSAPGAYPRHIQAR